MRKLLVTLAALFVSCASFAAVDVNTGTEAELDGVKGIGPALSGRILKARQQGPFKDWSDLMQRVKGIQPRSARQLSEAGLSVNGVDYPARQPTSAQ